MFNLSQTIMFLAWRQWPHISRFWLPARYLTKTYAKLISNDDFPCSPATALHFKILAVAESWMKTCVKPISNDHCPDLAAMVPHFKILTACQVLDDDDFPYLADTPHSKILTACQILNGNLCWTYLKRWFSLLDGHAPTFEDFDCQPHA